MIASEILVLVVLLAFNCVQSSFTENNKKINELNILLPVVYENLNDRSISYKLTAFNGCYQWSSSQSQYIDVNPIADTDKPICASNAIIRLAKNEVYQNDIWIYVRDKDTGDTMQVESRIGKISRIEILTKLRTIDVGDIQVFELLGFDEIGNSFTTLQGIRFTWSIQQSDVYADIVSIKDSQIQTTEMRKNLENKNFQSDILVLKGLKTGQAVIKATIQEPNYGEISTSVIVYVIEHFIVYPDYPVFLAPYSSLQYKLYIRQNDSKKTLRLINLPSQSYSWKSLNEAIGQVQGDGILNVFQKSGGATFSVSDTRTLNNTHHNDFSVIVPKKLQIQIRECVGDCWEKIEPRTSFSSQIESFQNSWNLVVNRKYYIRAFLYDDSRNQIIVTPNMAVQFEIDGQVFQVIEKRNHQVIVEPLELVQKTVLGAKLEKIKVGSEFKKMSPIAPASKDAAIFLPIKLINRATGPFVHLPFLQYSQQRLDQYQQTYLLRSLGGSGVYEYLSIDPQIVVVSQEGVVLPKGLGKTKVVVRDRKNSFNNDTIEVLISRVQRVASVEEMKEMVLLAESDLFTYALGQNEIPDLRYSNCSFLQFSVSQISSSDILIPLSPHSSSQSATISAYQFFLNKLHEIVDSNVYFQQILSKYSFQHQFDDFAQYIKNNLISEADLQKIFQSYQNYGVCNILAVQGIQTGERRVQVILKNKDLIDRPREQEEFSLKVYKDFSTIHPELKKVIISFGSSFKWSFEGGPVQWEGARLFHTEWDIVDRNNALVDKRKVKFNSVDKIVTGNFTKSYNFACNMPSSKSEFKQELGLRLRFYTWNEADEKLPRPVNMTARLQVICGVPQAIFVYTFAANQNPYQSKVYRLSKFQELNLRTPMHHLLKIWAFTQNKEAYYNFSSLTYTWSLSNTAVGGSSSSHGSTSQEIKGVAALSGIKPGDNFDVCIACIDAYMQLQLSATSAFDIILRVDSFSFKSQFGGASFQPHKLSDEVHLRLRDNLIVNPAFVNIFNFPENYIDVLILHGSGSFEIFSNDTSIIKYEERDFDSIRVWPLQLGRALITVRDQLQAASQEVHTTIQVVDVSRISLQLQSSLILQGGSTTAFLQVLDPSGRNFSLLQYKYMNLSLSVEAESEYSQTESLQFERDPISANQFQVTGIRRGHQRLVATLHENHPSGHFVQTLKSNVVDLQVFAPLLSDPQEITLTIGCTTTVSFKGGPSQSTLVYFQYDVAQASDDQIIEISELEKQLFSIRALSLGKATITFQVILRSSGLAIATHVVEVFVGMINSVQIIGMSDRVLHLGTSVRLICQVYIDHKSLTPGICPLQFLWSSRVENVLSIEQNNNIIDFSQINEDSKYLGEDFQMGINATTVGTGPGEIELQVISNQGKKKIQLRATAHLQVIDPLATQLPTYIQKPDATPSLLLIPPDSGFLLKTNKNTHFNLEFRLADTCHSKSGIRINSNGHIKTSSSKGDSATVIVNDMGTHSEIMHINVLTANIYSIFIEDSYKVLNLQVEADSLLKIYFQDSLGRSFPNELDNIDVRVKVTNPKIVQCSITEDKTFLNIKSKTSGISLVTVYLKDNQSVFDVFAVVVGSIVKPNSPVLVHKGGIVKFSVGSSSANPQNRWSVHDANIVKIDPLTGIATALSEGQTSIFYSDTVRYKTKVLVFQTDDISLTGNIKNMTNYRQSSSFNEQYEIRFAIIAKDQNSVFREVKRLYDNREINNNLDFKCETPNSDWFQVYSRIDDVSSETQVPQCIIKPRLIYPSGRLPNDLVLDVTVQSQSGDGFKKTQRFNLDFVWAFQISESQRSIEMSRSYPNREIQIQSTSHLEIQTNNALLKQCLRHHMDEGRNLYIIVINIPNTVQYNDALDAIIKVTHPQTGQSETIQVYYEPDSEAGEDKQGNIFSTLFDQLIALGFIAFFVYQFLSCIQSPK